jgi:XTP/dITP diphosphohydrolase
MEIVFATNNRHKLGEILKISQHRMVIRSLKEAGIETEIPEDYNSLEDNALQKALFIKENYGFDCIADDTGLEVEALNGEPGVFSARYARIGDPVFPEVDISEANIRKLLLKLENSKSRSARFRTVIALVMGSHQYFFEGIVNGDILKEPRGEMGFGYDPVFQPVGFTQSFAEMLPEEKNRISHRAIATLRLIEFLLKEGDKLNKNQSR